MLRHIKEIDIAPKYRSIIERPFVLSQVFERLWDSPLQGNVLVASDGSFIASNDTYRHMLGVTATELHRRTWQSFTPDEDRFDDEAESQKVANGEIDSHRMRKRYRKRDNQKIWVDMVVRGVFDEEGKFLFFTVNVTQVPMVESAIRPVHDINGQTIGVRPSINIWDFLRDNWRPMLLTIIMLVGGMLTIFATATAYFYIEFQRKLEAEYQRKYESTRKWAP
jgi:PAS domain S-box-containing protein